MEPGDLRESPAGSGESDVGGWREVTPGGEEEGEDLEVKATKTSGTKVENALRDACDEGGSERGVGDQLHSPYEEELDPRIQVRPPASGVPVSSSVTRINSGRYMITGLLSMKGRS